MISSVPSTSAMAGRRETLPERSARTWEVSSFGVPSSVSFPTPSIRPKSTVLSQRSLLCQLPERRAASSRGEKFRT